MPRSRRRQHGRRAFTLAEVTVASIIIVLVLGSISTSVTQLGRAKNSCKRRFDAHLRADVALNALRRDIISIVRSDDLFDTRFLLYDEIVPSTLGDLDRDEILVFNTRLRAVRDLSTFTGEGMEYETQYRVEDDEFGPALWQRRDTLPDEYLEGGGMAKPAVDNILGLSVEAYDGEQWFAEWDSDYDGLPRAVRITVTASGAREDEDPYSPDAPLAVLRTVVPVDRVLQPKDHFEAEEELLRELEAAEAAEEGGIGGSVERGEDGGLGGTDLESLTGQQGGGSSDLAGQGSGSGSGGGGGGGSSGGGGAHGGGGGQQTTGTRQGDT
ncbi:MAG: hypothetical protein SYC29_07070 [Planctomycetota bacterium]|nr:hypothetical protein [Planctomycetota bacterium]